MENTSILKTTWMVDSCPDANGFSTIREYDGTEHGNTDKDPIATVYSKHFEALIASAPELKKQNELLESTLTEILQAVSEHEDDLNNIPIEPLKNLIKSALKGERLIFC